MIKEELLGKQLRVIEATNESLVGISGEIVDETKNTLTIKTTTNDKKLLKEQITIEVENTRIDGKLLAQRPEKRTKLKIRTWQRKKPQIK